MRPLPDLPRPRPERVVLEGRYARLEPLDPERHGEELHAATFAPGFEERLRYLPTVPRQPDGYAAWLNATAAADDPLVYAVIDRATGRCGGRQALMRIVPEHGVIELGGILWGPGVARTRLATEAFALAAGYAFDALGYRRFEWKCDAANAPSRRAAERFGFTYEGTFRQHMVVRGRNRDTAWFALLDHEWPAVKAGLEAWLEPGNFDEEGRQRRSLAAERRQVAGPAPSPDGG